jgi:hypothetical protein
MEFAEIYQVGLEAEMIGISAAKRNARTTYM